MREGEYLAFEKDQAAAGLQLTGVDGFSDDQPMDLTDEALFDEDAEIITSGELARFGADKRSVSNFISSNSKKIEKKSKKSNIKTRL